MSARNRAIEHFHAQFGGAPEVIIRAPGRVNLMGEHTDYNDGFVLPMAIEPATWLAARSRPDRIVSVSSIGHTHEEFDLDDYTHSDAGWLEYVKGMAWTVGADRTLGWEGAFASDIPSGAGLSSSAALEVSTGLAFAYFGGHTWSTREAASAAHRCENDWVGVPCGIMDQLIVAGGHVGHAELIDCRTLAMRSIPIPVGIEVVILDTGTRRDLAESAYGERKSDCLRAAEAAGVGSLRDVSTEDLKALSQTTDPKTLRRARHVITENDRTLRTAAALESSDYERIGSLMAESHESLRRDFEVSSEALDQMVEVANGIDGCVGARMTGAGFGGCAVALVNSDMAGTFVEELTQRYGAVSNHQPEAYVTRAAAGATVEILERQPSSKVRSPRIAPPRSAGSA